jgi:hypothetical protein
VHCLSYSHKRTNEFFVCVPPASAQIIGQLRFRDQFIRVSLDILIPLIMFVTKRYQHIHILYLSNQEMIRVALSTLLEDALVTATTV